MAVSDKVVVDADVDAGRSPAELVLPGAGGYLFLQNDSNDNIGQLEGRHPIPDEALFGIAATHAARRVIGDQMRFRYFHAVAPSKEVVLRDLLPASVQYAAHGERPIERFTRLGCAKIHPLYYRPQVLEDEHRKRPTYFRTDTHWTWWGAQIYLSKAFERFDRFLGARFREVPVRRVSVPLPGDLGSKISAPEEETEVAQVEVPRATLVSDNGVAYHGRVRVYRRQDGAYLPTAVILHDSFLEFSVPQLAECFRKVTFVQSLDLDLKAISELKPDYVLAVQAERFFVRPPSNAAQYMLLQPELLKMW